jgi:HEAT repeat protein
MAFLEALGKIGDQAASGLLTRELENEDREIREAAIIALAVMGDKEAVVPLTNLLNHEDWEIRIYAKQVIKNLGT